MQSAATDATQTQEEAALCIRVYLEADRLQVANL